MKLGILLIVLFAFFMISCSSPKTIDNQVDMNAAGMYRTIEKNGDELTVTLHVVLPSNARFYFFEEKIPVNGQLIKSDIAPNNMTIKEVFVSDVKNANFSYTLKANRGTYIFNGKYLIDGDTTDQNIKGADRVTI